MAFLLYYVCVVVCGLLTAIPIVKPFFLKRGEAGGPTSGDVLAMVIHKIFFLDGA